MKKFVLTNVARSSILVKVLELLLEAFMTQWVYQFGGLRTDGNAGMKNLLGGKGANLAEIASLGLAVPPGFTITTEACNEYIKQGGALPAEAQQQIEEALRALSQHLDLGFGDVKKPLLVSVRSGARASMPGMMDTILNVGLNDQTVRALAELTNNEWFAYDSYRRLIEMYGDIVLKIARADFDNIKRSYIENNYLATEQELSTDHLQAIIEEYKSLIAKHGKDFPQDPMQQLWRAIHSVFESWQNERAIKYRKIHNIPEEWGTAVNVQSMVFGNFGNTSATGVCFTRNPSTGENALYGEFLVNAQGEDVVAGIRTPAQITLYGKAANFVDEPALEELMPQACAELIAAGKKLEEHFKDMQDIEFTIQNGRLWLLQTRSGKRSANAAVQIAVDMCTKEGVITKEEAVMKVKPEDIENLLHPTIDTSSGTYQVITKGLPASPGAASGLACFNSADAENKYKGQKVILIRGETSPEDIGGMYASTGVITARGGMTSHAAVVARGMGRPCVVGAGELVINEEERTAVVGAITICEGDKISINGATGEIILGEVKTKPPQMFEELLQLLTWCDEVRSLGVRANADTQEDASASRRFGAEGIGLCRTEHMFFDAERILSVRKMILAETEEARNAALSQLFVHQKDDFIGIFKAMHGLPVTIRLLDPPLHEFLPLHEAEFEQLASSTGKSQAEIRKQVDLLREVNPMLGHRGCRLAVSHPQIYSMQARAILEAAMEVGFHEGVEIMIPLVLNVAELDYCRDLIDQVAMEVGAHGIKYMVGTMIELPRAAITAGQLAKTASFFSFGTNDLTQTTLGLSRDDSSSFMHYYLDKHIFANDPFASIDVAGVGEMVRMACERGRQTNPHIKLGICGEHGGDPSSIHFFHEVGLDYVSCSPYRIPVARLAAAQALLQKKLTPIFDL